MDVADRQAIGAGPDFEQLDRIKMEVSGSCGDDGCLKRIGIDGDVPVAPEVAIGRGGGSGGSVGGNGDVGGDGSRPAGASDGEDEDEYCQENQLYRKQAHRVLPAGCIH